MTASHIDVMFGKKWNNINVLINVKKSYEQLIESIDQLFEFASHLYGDDDREAAIAYYNCLIGPFNINDILISKTISYRCLWRLNKDENIERQCHCDSLASLLLFDKHFLQLDIEEITKRIISLKKEQYHCEKLHIYCEHNIKQNSKHNNRI